MWGRSYCLLISMVTLALDSTQKKFCLSLPYTRNQYEIALWNRDVGVALNYSSSLLLMNALLWALKNRAASMSVSCVIAGQSEQDTDSLRNAMSGNVTTQLVLLPNLLSNHCRMFDQTESPRKLRKVRTRQRGRYTISRSIVDRMAGWTLLHLPEDFRMGPGEHQEAF